MIRLARRAWLLIALSLLASAATAYAECAWVLWERELVTGAGTPSRRSWQAIGGGDSAAECRAELGRSIQNAKETVVDLNRSVPPGEEPLSFSWGDSGHSTSRRGKDGWTRLAELRCLPQGTTP